MPLHKPSAAPILAVLAIVLVMLLGAYAGGYFCLGSTFANTAAVDGSENFILRTFDPPWLADFYAPAAKVEGWVRGIYVRTLRLEDWDTGIPWSIP